MSSAHTIKKGPVPPVPFKTIAIFGRQYIITSEKECEDLNEEEKNNLIGYCDFIGAKIFLKEGMDSVLALKTFWHEAVHVAQNEFCGDLDESEAHVMALFIHDILSNNPELVKQYIRGES
jgi:hypothetical protein